MKNLKRVVALLTTSAMLFGFSLTAFATDETETIYVSVSGSDVTGDGSFESPFATLEKVRDTMKDINKNVTINVKTGEYYVDSSFVMNSNHSGSDSKKITIKGENGTVFTGTKKINTNDFKHVTDPNVLKRLKQTARPNVLELDLNGYCNPTKDTALIFDNEKLIFSRYPNNGFLTAINDQYDTTFSVEDENVNKWENIDDLFMKGSFNATYRWDYSDIKKLEANGNITSSVQVRNNAKFYVNNVLEELDAVGEYAIDMGAGKLYCILPADYKAKTVEITTDTLYSHFMYLSNVNNVSIENIAFRGLKGNAILMQNCNNVTVKNCDFRFLDTENAIKIEKSTNITIDSNNAYELAGRFVMFSGVGGKTITPDNIKIINNVILNCATSYHSGGIIHSGIATTGVTDNVGNTIENNIIGDSSATHAVHAIGVNNQITKNEMYNVSRQIDDGGAVYFGKSNTKYGNEVSYNYIHHLNKVGLDGKEVLFAALYSDDGFGGVNMHHNVMNDMVHPIHIGMGMNNKFDNNMFLNITRGIRAQTRMTWGEDLYGNDGQLYKDTKNIVEGAETSAYKTAFDGALAKSLERKPFFAPWNSQIVGNVSFGTVNPVYETPNHKEGDNTINELMTYNGKLENNNTVALDKSYFNDYDKQDFTLKDSFTSNSELKQIKMSEIGNISANTNDLLKTETSFNVYPSQNGKKLVVYYGNNPSLTKYNITVSKNVDYSNPVLETEVFEDNMATAVETGDLEAGTYYIKAVATGLSKQSQYTLETTATFEVKDPDTISYDYAFSLLKDEVTKMTENNYEYDDETVKSELNAKYEALINGTNDKAKEEQEIYTLLSKAQTARKVFNPHIDSCEANQSNFNVYVTASGFEPNSMVTALVTNPNTSKDDFANGNKEIVRYTNVLTADNEGKLNFDFDTSVNSIDYMGTYTVYLSDVYGKVVSKTYEYGTIETSDITFKNGNTVVDIADFENCKGLDLTANIKIDNRISDGQTINVVLGTYKFSRLTGVTFESKTLTKNSKNNVSVSFKVPDNYDSDTSLELMITDGENVLKPLTLKRVIKEAKN